MTMSSSSEVFPCQVCGSPSEKRCSRCYVARYCSTECQKKDWKEHKKDGKCKEETELEHRKRITEEDKAKVEVKASGVHGKGVFATEDLPAETLVCYYAGTPKDAGVRVRMRKDQKTNQLTIVNAQEVFTSVAESKEDGDRCMAHPDPKKTEVRVGKMEEGEGCYGVGQFINDGARPEIGIGDDFSSASRVLHDYQNKSQQRANCEVTKKHFWFKTTREVKAGEELFAHYGFEFWTQKLMLSSGVPESRLLCYALSNQSSKPFDLRKFFDYDEETIEQFLLVLLGVDRELIEKEMATKVLADLTGRIGIGAEPITML